MTGSRGGQVGGIKGGVVWGLQVSKCTLADCVSLTISLIYGDSNTAWKRLRVSKRPSFLIS